jgi:hypothetical protein
MSAKRNLQPVTTPDGPPTFEQAMATITPQTARARLCLDQTSVRLVDELSDELEEARTRDVLRPADEARAPDVARRLLDALEGCTAGETEFVFQYIGRKMWKALLAEHPPTDRDNERGADFNTETFPLAAMIAACVEPADATPELFEELMDRVTAPQWDLLWTAAHQANTGSPEMRRLTAYHQVSTFLAQGKTRG